MSTVKDERIPPRARLPKGNGFAWISSGRRSRLSEAAKVGTTLAGPRGPVRHWSMAA